MEELSAELQRKEKDLILSAQLGKSLLEENEKLRSDLSKSRADLATLEKVRMMMRAS